MLPDGVEFEDRGGSWILRAARDLTRHDVRDDAPRYDDPTVAVTVSTSVPLGELAMVGFAATQFALPVRAEPGGVFDFAPASNLRAPPVALPLLLFAPDGTVELLAPLNAWHEQLICVLQDARIEELRWGWHGDLVDIPADFTAELGIFTGTSVHDVLRRWGDTITSTAAPTATSAATSTATSTASPRQSTTRTDPLLTHLSYWTDNGAAYWYRTEPELDLATTLERKAAELNRLGVGIGSFELDSWFYPHEISREVREIGYLDEVPPTGMMTWTPRPDVLPDGIEALRDRLGNPPLVLHSRHISTSSPYLDDADEGEWWDDFIAHPTDPAFFRRWFDDARAWGATCIEQDWMMMTYFGVRGLRESPGRTMAWQRGLDDAATRTDMSLLWCMSLPGDIVATVELSNVVAVRTCDDYRFAEDPAMLWVWYLTVNALCSALGIAVFKDCFFSATLDAGAKSDSDPDSSAPTDDIDGDPYPEVEALLSAMSGGIAGIGDRIGRTDVDVIARLCRFDGLLFGPDRPISLTDASFRRAGRDGATLCWASTDTGEWTYIVALHVDDGADPIHDHYDLGAQTLVYDWRTGTAEVTTTITATLEHRGWALFVCCPLRHDGNGERSALIGDPGRYATMSRRRVDVSGDEPVLLTGESESMTTSTTATLRWWSDRSGVHDRPAPSRHLPG